MKTLSLLALGTVLMVFNASADTAFSRKVASYSEKEKPKQSRVELRAPTVKLPEFDGVKLDMTKDNQVKVIALFKYLKKKDKPAWEFVKKNIVSVSILKETHPNYSNANGVFAPLLKRADLNPKWVNQIKPKDKVPIYGRVVTTIVHEAGHSDIYHNQKRPKHTEAEVDVYRSQVQERIDASPL